MLFVCCKFSLTLEELRASFNLRALVNALRKTALLKQLVGTFSFPFSEILKRILFQVRIENFIKRWTRNPTLHKCWVMIGERLGRYEANDNFFGHAERYLDAFMDVSSYAERFYQTHAAVYGHKILLNLWRFKLFTTSRDMYLRQIYLLSKLFELLSHKSSIDEGIWESRLRREILQSELESLEIIQLSAASAWSIRLKPPLL